MNYDYLSTDQAMADFCRDIAGSSLIAFDTEFVSEDRYYPELCLVQVAAGDRLAILDPLAGADLGPFWQLVSTGTHITVVHAGREEFRFCRRASGARPVNLFDTQLASGLIGLDYPAAYGSLLQKLLGKTLGKGETRTNWRRRPLSKRQLEYALQDVVYLEPLYERIAGDLARLGRRQWLDDELAVWQDQLEQEETTERWRRVSGISGLSRRQLAILHELWRWRDVQARSRDIPARRVLRDDLMLELARRASDEEQQIRAVRGMDWRKLQRAIPEIAACVTRGLAVPDEVCPYAGPRTPRPQYGLLGQFLATAVNSMARAAQVAPGLVGSVQDVRDLIAHHLGHEGDEAPALAIGWRAEVVGQVIDRLLDGELSIRITDPNSNQPLSFEPRSGGAGGAPARKEMGESGEESMRG